ncbi:MAG TPA: ABC transporter ATP-binding protein [Rhizomicrobium sp.]
MIIEADDLHKSFGRHDALKGASFAVPQGAAFALIGANGAGKTTTIKLVMNILTPSRGNATVLGVDSRRLSPRELAQIGYVSENTELPPGLSVAGYLDYWRPFYPAWDRALEQSLLAQFDLPPARKIRDLSHGMRMKLAFAAALSYRPKLLILDEPFSGLDPLVRDDLMEVLLGQAGETTIFVSSHELNEIEGMVSHVGFLEDGKLLFQNAMEDLSARLREVRVTLEGAAALPLAPPGTWLNPRIAGNVLTFVDTQYSADELGPRLTALVGPVRLLEAQPMGLRAMFTALARRARNAEA